MLALQRRAYISLVLISPNWLPGWKFQHKQSLIPRTDYHLAAPLPACTSHLQWLGGSLQRVVRHRPSPHNSLPTPEVTTRPRRPPELITKLVCACAPKQNQHHKTALALHAVPGHASRDCASGRHRVSRGPHPHTSPADATPPRPAALPASSPSSL